MNVSVMGMGEHQLKQPWGAAETCGTHSTDWVGARDGDTFPPCKCSLGGAEPNSGSCKRYRSKSHSAPRGQGGSEPHFLACSSCVYVHRERLFTAALFSAGTSAQGHEISKQRQSTCSPSLKSKLVGFCFQWKRETSLSREESLNCPH